MDLLSQLNNVIVYIELNLTCPFGVTPTDARKPGVKLNYYPTMSFSLQLQGDSLIKLRIVEKDSFELIGTGTTIEELPTECQKQPLTK